MVPEQTDIYIQKNLIGHIPKHKTKDCQSYRKDKTIFLTLVEVKSSSGDHKKQKP